MGGGDTVDRRARDARASGRSCLSRGRKHVSETRELSPAGPAQNGAGPVEDAARPAPVRPPRPRTATPGRPEGPDQAAAGAVPGAADEPATATVWPGAPHPLGARFHAGPDGRPGTNFALWARGAESVELCLFDADGRETRAPLAEQTHEVWHGFVPGVLPGQRYGYRVGGRWDPWTGARFNPAKLLLDPYARAVDGEFSMAPEVYGHVRDWPERDVADTVRDNRDSAAYVPKGVVVEDDDDWEDDRRPKTPWSDSVIYELHVRGLDRKSVV